jgi:AcrR family transcriptional regulator
MSDTVTSRQFEIIEAAGKLLTISGIGGLTIKNLANEMKFSQGAIYRHFDSKEKIILAMLEFLAVTLDERNTGTILKTLKTEEKLKTLFNNKLDFFSKNPHFVVAVFSDGLMEESQSINDSISKLMKTIMKHLIPIIIEGQKNGFIVNTIPEKDVVHIIMGSMRLLMYKWRVANFEFDIINDGNAMIESILTLIKTKSN